MWPLKFWCVMQILRKKGLDIKLLKEGNDRGPYPKSADTLVSRPARCFFEDQYILHI